jgi:hypothetical protein
MEYPAVPKRPQDVTHPPSSPSIARLRTQALLKDQQLCFAFLHPIEDTL